jgi:hypothetical protein
MDNWQEAARLQNERDQLIRERTRLECEQATIKARLALNKSQDDKLKSSR